MTIHHRFACAVQLLREERGWSQGEFDTRMGWQRGKTSRLEAGDVVLRIEVITLVALQFGMAAWELLRFADRLQETVVFARHDTPPVRERNWRAA